METAAEPIERIGRYEILRRISAGELAQIFLARQLGSEGFAKTVLIKRIHDEIASEEDFVKSFLEEARLAARLSHPNLIQVFDLGKQGDAYFIAMEYVAGRNLERIRKRARLRNTPVQREHIARWIADACAGLHHAHTRTDQEGKLLKIVHRGVSPRKLIVTFSGTLKLGDFGTAKAATQLARTRPGMLSARDYGYMSPEQIRSDALDARSDVFACGVVLYEMLTGRHPFKRGNPILTMTAIVEEPPPDCRGIDPSIPKPLAAIVERALHKRRSKRYPDAEEFQVALEDYITTTGKRIDRAAIGASITELFEDELKRGRAVFEFPGIGEVILPEMDEPESPRAAMLSPTTAIVPEDATVIQTSGEISDPSIATVAAVEVPMQFADGATAKTETFEEMTAPLQDAPPRPKSRDDPRRIELPGVETITKSLSGPITDRDGIASDPTSAAPGALGADTEIARAVDHPTEAGTFDVVDPTGSGDGPSGSSTIAGELSEDAGPAERSSVDIDLSPSSVVVPNRPVSDPADDEAVVLKGPALAPTSQAPKSYKQRAEIATAEQDLDRLAAAGRDLAKPIALEPTAEHPPLLDPEALIEEAFAEFRPPPKEPPPPIEVTGTQGEVGAQSEPAGQKKRDIREVFRPGPAAPTEFNPGLADQAGLALADAPVGGIELPQITRERVVPPDAPVVVEVPARAPAVVAPALPQIAVPAFVPQASPPIVDRRPTPVPAARPTPVPAARPTPVQAPPSVPLDRILAGQSAPDPALQRQPRVRSMSVRIGGALERLSPRVLVTMAVVAVLAALLLLFFSIGRTEIRLTVRSTPTEADIFINGELQAAKTTATITGLKPNVTYEVRVTKEGYENIPKAIMLPPRSQNLILDFKLRKLADIPQ
jgi:hypothetical protein